MKVLCQEIFQIISGNTKYLPLKKQIYLDRRIRCEAKLGIEFSYLTWSPVTVKQCKIIEWITSELRVNYRDDLNFFFQMFYSDATWTPENQGEPMSGPNLRFL